MASDRSTLSPPEIHFRNNRRAHWDRVATRVARFYALVGVLPPLAGKGLPVHRSCWSKESLR